MANKSQSFKIVLVGDGGVGKTCTLKRILVGNFEKRYLPTIGVEVHPLTFNTNYGRFILNIWDTAGQERFGGLRDGYFIQTNGFMIFSDYTSTSSFKNIPWWEKEIKRVNEYAPVVLCMNKADVPEREVKELDIQNLDFDKDLITRISAKSSFRIYKPFELMLRKLTGKKDLVINTSVSLEEIKNISVEEFEKNYLKEDEYIEEN